MTSSSTNSEACWLMKAEPESRLEKGKDVAFSISHLAQSPNQTTIWDGVRNHQAKNHMVSMKLNQRILFYHSNCKVPGIAGLAAVSSDKAFPDPSALDSDHPYFDPKSKEENPTWFTVEVRFVRQFQDVVPLELLKLIGNGGLVETQKEELDTVLSKEMVEAISQMTLIKTGRLSVQPVPAQAYDAIIALAANASVWCDWPGKWNPSKIKTATKFTTPSTSKAASADRGTSDRQIRKSERTKRKIEDGVQGEEGKQVRKKKSRSKATK